MIRCYITDRHTCPVDLLDNIEKQARVEGIEYIQLREKDLPARQLADLARAAVRRIAGTSTKLLINTRADVCLAAGAHGLHVPSNSVPASAWRCALSSSLVISVSCHTLRDLTEAAPGADFAFFSPVFPSPGKGPAVGVAALAEAARIAPLPVLALGGVTWDNADACVAAGAAGIAGIRLFQR